MNPDRAGMGCVLAILAFLVTGGVVNASIKDANEAAKVALFVGLGVFCLIAFGGQLPALASSRPDRGHEVDPYLPGLHHERIHEFTLQGGRLHVALDAVEHFVRAHLSQWARTDQRTNDRGTDHYFRFDRSFTQTWQVRPNSVAARMQEGFRAGQGGPIRSIASVPYEVQCHLTVRQEGVGAGQLVRMTLRVHEDIDPRGTVRDFPLGQEWVAPSFLWTRGYFGEEFVPFLSRRLQEQRD